MHLSVDSPHSADWVNTKVRFKTHNQESNGEVYFCIGRMRGAEHRILTARHILSYNNNVISSVYLDLDPPFSIDEEEEIARYIPGMPHYKACRKLSMDYGSMS